MSSATGVITNIIYIEEVIKEVRLELALIKDARQSHTHTHTHTHIHAYRVAELRSNNTDYFIRAIYNAKS